MLIHQVSSGSQAGDQSYRHLLQHLPICIFVVDLTVTPAVILEVNRRIEMVYGYRTAELIGNPAAQLVAEESKGDVQNIFQRVQQGQMVTAEIICRHRDGTVFPVRTIATLDPADSGHTIMVVEDMTTERQRRSEAEAIDAERLRIAHEIHDGVAQTLASLRFKLALWSQLTDGILPETRSTLEEVQAVLVTTITDLRRAILALRPLDLETLGFLPALNQFVTNFGDQNQLSARLEVSGQPTNMLMMHELPLFRIIQEGLNNIHQHANASSVLVHLTVDTSGSVMTTIRDNGRGFDPNLVGMANHSVHFGLRQMRERIQDLGGTLDICSAVGHGTELLITLPRVTQEVNHGIDSHLDRR